MPVLTLPRDVVDALVERARASTEICGLLSSRGGRYARHFPVRNVAAEPTVRFDMDPAELIAALRQMREAGESLLAIYHSHPVSEAVPSAADLAEHAYPQSACLILAPAASAATARAFRIRDGAADELLVELSD